MNGFEVSEERWPIVSVRFIGPPADTDYTELLARFDELYTAREPFITLVDATTYYLPTPSQMRMCIQWRIENSQIVKRFSIGIVWVVRSVVANVTLNTINRLSPLPSITRVFMSADAAFVWSENMLKALGSRAAEDLQAE